jgi:hypothetical protein
MCLACLLTLFVIRSAFAAASAVTWLQKNLKFGSRTDAVLLCNNLLKEKYIGPLAPEKEVRDSIGFSSVAF